LHDASCGNRGTLALRRGETTVALVGVTPELRHGATQLSAAVHGAAHDLVIAGRPYTIAVGGLLDADAVRPGGEDLVETVRRLQADGRVVVLVAAGHASALIAADCGIGVLGFGDPPWGAHIISPSLGEVPIVLEATVLARSTAQRSVVAAGVGSALASVLALGPGGTAARRSLIAGHTATLVGIGLGTWNGLQLLGSRVVRTHETVDWHALAPGDVLDRLRTTPAGLTSDDASRRAVAPPMRLRSPGVGDAFVAQLSGPLTAVLGVGAALSVAAGSVADGVLIGAGIAVTAGVGAVQRLRTDAAIRRLSNSLSDGVARVWRDGSIRELSPDEVVPGDILLLRAGDTVPADGRVLDAVALEVDESSLTGESLPVAKQSTVVPIATAVGDRRSMVFAGTAVAAGDGEVVVVAVGDAVEAQRDIELGSPPPATGVERRLQDLTSRVVPGVIGAGAVLIVNALLRGAPTRDAVATGVSLAAAAVPEGLPFLATAAQASAARRLSAHGVLVRNPSVLEALGRVDVVCFDKTGTLTKGRLEVRTVDDGDVAVAMPELLAELRPVLAAALRATPVANGERLPHPTDQAVVEAASRAELAADDGAPGWSSVHDLPFQPANGYHAVLGRNDEQPLLSVKGAPEVVLGRCRTRRRANGDVVGLDDEGRDRLHARASALARGGLRVLAVAERVEESVAGLRDEHVNELVFVGFLGIADAARTDAAAAIEEMRAAGIALVMMTGDHWGTAQAVARELGLPSGSCITGSELDRMDDAELDRRVDEVGVFARVTPAHKVRVVRAYQRLGRIVAMTGDGANDAQAIRLADIGIAFGSRATPAARDAADVVIRQGDAATIVRAIAAGRAMWASVRNGLGILLGGNLGEVVFTTGIALVSGSSPLNTRQLLAVNLLTDLAPAMAIASQPPPHGEIDVWREGPEASLGSALARDIGIRAAATAGGATGAWLVGRATGTRSRASTIAFVALVGSQLGQTLVLGWRRPVVAASALVSTGAMFVLVQTPGVSRFFGCRPLGPLGWATAATCSSFATMGAVVAGAVVARHVDDEPAATRVIACS
jgi:cation-transporting ATPase I